MVYEITVYSHDGHEIKEFKESLVCQFRIRQGTEFRLRLNGRVVKMTVIEAKLPETWKIGEKLPLEAKVTDEEGTEILKSMLPNLASGSDRFWDIGPPNDSVKKS